MKHVYYHVRINDFKIKKKRKKKRKNKKNAFESVLMRWMKLEPIIRSKVRIFLK